jgi:cytochrome b6-f complex iron-sulfur subunit
VVSESDQTVSIFDGNNKCMSDLSRRDFIRQSTVLGACACCFGTLTLIESCSTSGKTSSTTVLDEKSIVETPGKITIAKSAFGGQKYVKVTSGKFAQPIFVNTNADGTYTAVLMLCTHKGCDLKASDGKLICPCHGSQFDTAGHVLNGPAKTDLQTFQVSADEQHVILTY